jgi:ABC-type bacteriocin/lantibiotic exporter with double-glycine peptidase domain
MKILLWIIGIGIVLWASASLTPMVSFAIVIVYYLSKISTQLNQQENQRKIDEWHKRQREKFR